MLTGAGVFTTNWILDENHQQSIISVVSKTKKQNYPEKIQVADLSDYQQVALMVQRFKPDLIVNAAALTDIEVCEKFPSDASKANYEIPRNLAEVCRDQDILLVQLSTDNFTNRLGEIRDENVTQQAINEYGRTKILGEQSIIRSGVSHIIIRTNFIGFAPAYKSTFLDKILYNLKAGIEIKGFSDYFFNPVTIDYLKSIILRLVDLEFRGVINVGSDEKISKYGFAQLIALKYGLRANLIKDAKMESELSGVLRPQNLFLDNTKLKRILQLKSIRLEEQIDLMTENSDRKIKSLNGII
jgi:dTDP-4-dehydrorhamnose reductase